jgi:adenylate kinase
VDPLAATAFCFSTYNSGDSMALYLIIMGVQGAGKGTQAGYICEEYHLSHVSTGELFRALKTREDDFAKKIQAIMASGQLVSDADTNEVLKEHLESGKVKSGGVLFDGYPRNIAQAQWLDQYLAAKGEKLAAVLLLELDLYTAFKRAFGRVSHPSDSNTTYNIYYNADGIEYQFVDHPDKQFAPRLEAKLLATGEPLNRRPDDASAHAVIKRIDTYMETTTPLVDYYAKKGLVVRINADQPIDAVSAQIKQAIEEKRKS